MTKGLTYIVLGVTMTIGGYAPTLFGYSFLSGWSMLGSLVGLAIGVFIAIKLSKMI